MLRNVLCRTPAVAGTVQAAPWRLFCTAPPAKKAKTEDRPRLPEVYVQDGVALDDLLEHCSQAQVIGIDTEFIAFPSFVPKLQLVQVATPTMLAVVDYVKVQREGLNKLVAMFDGREVVMHGSNMDVRIIGHLTGKIPQRLFDTQTAASLVGMGQLASLGNMIEELVGVAMDKSQTLTDWSKRPLSENQIDYAMNDVRYLLAARDRLEDKLIERGRKAIFDEEMQLLSRVETYRPEPPEEAWRMFKRLNNMEGLELAILRELAKWRELQARQEDVLPFLVMRDDALMAMANQKVSTKAEIKNVQGLKPYMADKYGNHIIEAVKRGLDCPPENYPKKNRVDEPLDGRFDGEACLLQTLSAWARAKTSSQGYGGNLVLSNTDLKRFAIYSVEELEQMDLNVLKGWRRELVGEDLLAIKKGLATVRWVPEKHALELTPYKQ